MPSSVCIYQGDEYLLQGSLLGVVHGMCEEFGILPDWGGGTDAYTPIGSQLRLEDDRLFLVELEVRTEDQQYPPISGVTPSIPSGRGEYAKYVGLHVPIVGDGTLYLLKEQVWSSGDLSGFSTPYDYSVVLEVTVKEGHVVSVADRSEDARLDRERRGPSPTDVLVSILQLDKSIWPRLQQHMSASPPGTWNARETWLVSQMCRVQMVTRAEDALILTSILDRVGNFNPKH